MTMLLVLDDVAVASELLLEVLQDPLEVVLIRHTLERSEGLPSVPLLDTDVYVFSLGGVQVGLGAGQTEVFVVGRERIVGPGEVLNPAQGSSGAFNAQPAPMKPNVSLRMTLCNHMSHEVDKSVCGRYSLLADFFSFSLSVFSFEGSFFFLSFFTFLSSAALSASSSVPSLPSDILVSSRCLDIPFTDPSTAESAVAADGVGLDSSGGRFFVSVVGEQAFLGQDLDVAERTGTR